MSNIDDIVYAPIEKPAPLSWTFTQTEGTLWFDPDRKDWKVFVAGEWKTPEQLWQEENFCMGGL